MVEFAGIVAHHLGNNFIMNEQELNDPIFGETLQSFISCYRRIKLQSERLNEDQKVALQRAWTSDLCTQYFQQLESDEARIQ